jgi:hypothetical protein
MECGGCRQLGAPGLLLNFDAQGNAAQGIQIKFDNPTGGDVNHFMRPHGAYTRTSIAAESPLHTTLSA